MGLFRRKSREDKQQPAEQPGFPPEPGDTLTDDLPQQAESQPLVQEDRDGIAAALERLQNDGVAVDDLTSLGDGLDTAYRDWARTHEGDHGAIIERYAVGIGEHLSRHTDLDWRIVTDVFGTDLGLLDGPRGAFMVVPRNLVAGRWMRGETGWIPGVVAHLVRCRER